MNKTKNPYETIKTAKTAAQRQKAFKDSHFHMQTHFPLEERDRILKAIGESGLTMSEFIRQAINYFIESSRKQKRG